MLDTIIIDCKDCTSDEGVLRLTTTYPLVATIRDGYKLTIGVLKPN